MSFSFWHGEVIFLFFALGCSTSKLTSFTMPGAFFASKLAKTLNFSTTMADWHRDVFVSIPAEDFRSRL